MNRTSNLAILRHDHNRNPEVWGSIPHGSTRKNENAAQKMRGVFVFGARRDTVPLL
jgi:hypothetical protein